MADEKKGIKESLELIEGLKVIGVDVAKAFADGKIGLEDAPLLLDLATKQKVLVDAFSGLGELGVEVKDLDMVELQAIVAALFSAAKDVMAAKG